MNQAENAVRRTGVVGLGAMGLQMARHMGSKGFSVAGYDIDTEVMRRAQEQGVRICSSVAEVGAQADVVIGGAGIEAGFDQVVAQVKAAPQVLAGVAGVEFGFELGGGGANCQGRGDD